MMRINDDDGSGGGKSNQLFVWVCIALLLEENIKMVEASPRQGTISSSPWTTFSAFLSNFTQFVTVLYSFLHILYRITLTEFERKLKDAGVLLFFARRYEDVQIISACSRAHNEKLPTDCVLYKFATKPFIIIPPSFLTMSLYYY